MVRAAPCPVETATVPSFQKGPGGSWRTCAWRSQGRANAGVLVNGSVCALPAPPRRRSRIAASPTGARRPTTRRATASARSRLPVSVWRPGARQTARRAACCYLFVLEPRPSSPLAPRRRALRCPHDREVVQGCVLPRHRQQDPRRVPHSPRGLPPPAQVQAHRVPRLRRPPQPPGCEGQVRSVPPPGGLPAPVRARRSLPRRLEERSFAPSLAQAPFALC